LRNANFDKASEIEVKINAHKNENLQKICRPTSVVVLYEYEKAKLKVLKEEWCNGFHFQKHQLSIKSPAHPTNIIWENDAQTRCG
jgi:hypothetical protein